MATSLGRSRSPLLSEAQAQMLGPIFRFEDEPEPVDLATFQRKHRALRRRHAIYRMAMCSGLLIASVAALTLTLVALASIATSCGLLVLNVEQWRSEREPA